MRLSDTLCIEAHVWYLLIVLQGKTKGLFGIWNDNAEDDLTPRPGGAPIPPTDTKTIHLSFGITCELTPISIPAY